MHLLIVEDEVKLAKHLEKGLREEGFHSTVVHDGADALTLALKNHYDLIILDCMLPSIDGMTILAALRSKQSTPVLILTARSSVEDRVLGLRSGADDYLVKPFAFSELVARIHVLLRRSVHNPQETTRVRISDLEVDLMRRHVSRGGRKIELTTKEFNVLSLLIERKGAIVSRTDLASHVWGLNFDSATNVVEVVIRRLRQKMDVPFDKPLLRTIRGMGYIIEEK
ncbi:MAG: heavy metal response regulator transcription factor [Pusillimonas sp.]